MTPPVVVPNAVDGGPVLANPNAPPDLRVFVRDEFDAPIPNARVTIDWSRTRGTYFIITTEPVEAAGTTGPLGQVEAWGVPPGPVLVSAGRPTYVKSRPTRADLFSGRTAEVRLQLALGLSVIGHVFDETGASFGRVEVEIEQVESQEPRLPLTPLLFSKTLTDEAGKFVLEGLQPGDYILRASNGQWGEERVSIPVTVPASPIELRLRRPHTDAEIQVRIASETGEEFTHCFILGYPLDGRGTYFPIDQRKDGGFAAKVRAGEYRVVADCAKPTGLAESDVAIASGATADVMLTVHEGLTLAGLVVAADGRPVAGVRVVGSRLVWSSRIHRPGDFSSTVSDAQGRFVLKRLDNADYRLSAWKENSDAQSSEVVARPNEGRVTLQLERPRQVRGRVVDQRHAPVTHFVLDGHTITSADGTFQETLYVENPPAKEITVFVPGVGSQRVPIPSGTGVLDIGDVVLVPERTARGRVIDAQTGAPVESALIEPEPESFERLNRHEHYNGGADVVGSVRSDSTGHFEFQHANDRVPVLVTHPAYWRMEAFLSAGENLIRLVPGAVIEGRVSSTIERTCVEAAGNSHVDGYREMLTDSSGRFRFEGLGTGWWTVTAGCGLRRGFESAVVQITSPGTYSVLVPEALPP